VVGLVPEFGRNRPERGFFDLSKGGEPVQPVVLV
jgi:hypothetical protein